MALDARCLGQDTEHVWHLPGKLSTGKADEVGTGDHGDVREAESERSRAGICIIDGEGSGDEGP